MKLYHGSRNKLELLKPKQSTGLNSKKNRQFAVYATDKKDRAIGMALLNLEGIKKGTELEFLDNKIIGIIYDGWPTQEEFYLYTLNSDKFSKIDDWQWISKEEVIPIKVETLKAKDYIHMLRKGTEEEKNKYLEKRSKVNKELNK